MNDYKGWTEKQRLANLRRVKKLIAGRELADPNTIPCESCGLEEGIREWHCTNYDDDKWRHSLKCLCYMCHRNLHIYELGPENPRYRAACEYFAKVHLEGYQRPVFRRKKTREEQ